MSEENRDPSLVQYGRPLRKRSRGPKPQSADSGTPAVGPVVGPVPVDGAETIVRADRPPAIAGEVLGAPKPRPAPREPDDVDQNLSDLVAFMARGIVDRPERVQVRLLEAGDDAAYELVVHPDDLGHVIGKQGRTARSLRLALGASAARTDRDVSLEIAD